jgi:F420-dependent oxidoreductase-like protein
MKIGLQIYHFDWPGSPQNIGSKLAEIAKTADDAGFSSLWVMDHFFQIGGGFGQSPEDPMLEGYSVISYMAAMSKRIKLGLMVTGNPYCHPGILIKTVTTLDVLSGGRAYFGIGAGWYEREAKGLGVPFPPLRERFERLEETLKIAKHMWSGDRSPFNGRHYHLAEPINNPQPISQPHPPILIGGEGEKKLLRLVAEYGDACNFQLGTSLKEYPQWYRDIYSNHKKRLFRKLDLLKEHCLKVGRPYEEIERTVLGTIKLAPDAMQPAEIVELCRELGEIGIQHVIFNMPNVQEVKPLVILGNKVIPVAAEF